MWVLSSSSHNFCKNFIELSGIKKMYMSLVYHSIWHMSSDLIWAYKNVHNQLIYY